MLQIDAILPDAPAIDPDALLRAVTEPLDLAATLVKRDFDSTVKTWNEKPAFAIESPNSYERDIYTTDQVYAWVNNGTPAHEILPIRAHALAFMTGGQSKTQPNAIGSGAGMPGDNPVVVHRVQHPGIAARNFDEIIAADYAERFPEMVQKAINEATV